MAKKKKGLFKKIWNGIKDSARGIAKIGGKIYEAETYVVLAPFKGAMKKQLDKAGIKHGNKMKNIAPLFFKHIIKGKKNYENYVGDLKHYENYEALENLDALDALEMVNVPDVAFVNHLDSLGEEEAVETAKNIISVVFDFFKNLLQKKLDKKPTTSDEDEMAKDAEKGAENADKLIEKEHGGKMDYKTIGIVAVVIIALFVFMRKK